MKWDTFDELMQLKSKRTHLGKDIQRVTSDLEDIFASIEKIIVSAEKLEKMYEQRRATE